MDKQHVRHFEERRSTYTGDRMFVAFCSCGWRGTAGSTKALAGKCWHRHHEAATSKAA